MTLAIDCQAMVKAMRSSWFNLFMYSAPKSDEDLARMAELPLQLGMALMLDMPIVMLVKEGEPIPRKVRSICDKIVTVDYSDMEAAKEVVMRAIREFEEERNGPAKQSE